ncbi:MAG: gamma-glutamylcyclotransferase [Tepidimonas taiwanensis]|nr:gamma-glutamylcyclotransferase [Tepidimonas taiwanensis]
MDVWIFAYGSLMWNPEFPVAESVVARLDGWRRSFCLRSVEHRGTREVPGLVLGLDADPGAHCMGLALRLPAEGGDQIVAAVRARELVTDAYLEERLPLALADGRRITALAYVMRRDHWQYAGGLAPDEQAGIIAGARGGRGPNADYLFNTALHLAQLGLADAEMEALADRVRARLAAERAG